MKVSLDSHAMPRPLRPVAGDAERHRRYLRAFCEDWRRFDGPGWRIAGLDSLSLGSALPEATGQEQLLREGVAGGGAVPLPHGEREREPPYFSILNESFSFVR